VIDILLASKGHTAVSPVARPHVDFDLVDEH